MRKLLSALIVGGALVATSAISATEASAHENVGFNVTIIKPGYILSVSNPTFIPLYDVVVPRAYVVREYRTGFAPRPERPMRYTERQPRPPMDRHRW